MLNTFSKRFSSGLLRGYGHRRVHIVFVVEPISGAAKRTGEAEPLASPEMRPRAVKRIGKKTYISCKTKTLSESFDRAQRRLCHIYVLETWDSREKGFLTVYPAPGTSGNRLLRSRHRGVFACQNLINTLATGTPGASRSQKASMVLRDSLTAAIGRKRVNVHR
jgi:hypothetical protein